MMIGFAPSVQKTRQLTVHYGSNATGRREPPAAAPQPLSANTQLNDQQVLQRLLDHNKLLQGKKELDQLLSKWEKLRFDVAAKVGGTELWFEENHRKSGWLDFNGCDPKFYDKVKAEYEVDLLNLAASEKNCNIVTRRIDAFNRKKSDYKNWLSSHEFKEFLSNSNNLKEISGAYKTGSTFLQKVGIKKGNELSHIGNTYTLRKIDNTLYVTRQDKPHPILIVTGENGKITDVVTYGFDDNDKQLFQTVAKEIAKEMANKPTNPRTLKPTINRNKGIDNER